MTTNQAEEKLIKARIRLQSRNPFFSYLSLYIKFKKDENKELPNHAGAGISPNGVMTYKEEFINELNDEECIGLLTHEILHCLTPDMVVGTKDLNISEISVNDMAICDNGQHYNIEKTKGRKYNGDLLTIQGQGVLPLKITPNHRVNRIQFLKWKTIGTRKENNRKNVRELSKREYVNAEKLKKGDYLIIPKIQSDKQFKNYIINLTPFSRGNDWSKKLKPKIKLDNEIAYFVGRFLADGWTNKHPKSNVIEFAFNKAKENQADKIVLIIKKKFNLTPKKYFLKRNEKEQGVWRVMFQNRMLKEFIREEIGTYSNNKIIPDWILYNPDLEILKNCLKGMYDGDGWISYKDNQKRESFGYCSVSKGMILKLQKALTRLNCFGSIAERQARQDLIIFEKLMTKKKDLKTQYIVRCQDKNLFDLFNITYKKQRATKHYLDLGDSFAVRIKTIKKEKYEGEVYNIKTPRENYTANNILVHNCAFLHMIRRGSREHEKWNIAIDLAVNSTLKENGFELPKNGIIPNDNNIFKFPIGLFKKACEILKVNEKTAEEIYEELPELNYQNGNCSCGKGKGNSFGGCSKCCKGFDEHSEENKDGKGKPSQSEKQELENEWLNRLEEAYVSAKQRGKLPLGLERYIDEIKKSQISWKVLLQKLIQATIPRDYTYCVDKNTKIKTLNGYIKIKDLKKGRYVIGYKNGKLVKSKIKDKFSSEVKEEYTIKTKNNEIKCSPNHRILTTKGYKKAKDLIKSDIILKMKIKNKNCKLCKKSISRLKCRSCHNLKDKLSKSKVIHEEIISIKKKSCNKTMWDIETETKNFIANNIITHNCRRGKKSFATKVYFPDVTKEKIDICIGIDLSGSIGKEELTEFMSEVIGMARAYQNSISMRLLTHDVEVHNDYEIINGNIAKIKKLKLKGGGGTSHEPIFKYIDEKVRDCKAVVFFTDGYSDLEGIDFSKHRWKKIFVINKHGSDECVKGRSDCVCIKMKEDRNGN